jgi:hypothetical protein
VNAAFASELYLKCIIGLEGKRVPTSHDLGALYAMISGPAQRKMELLWDELYARAPPGNLDAADRMIGRKLPRDLPTVLAEGSRAFEQFRYLYEGGGESSVTFLFPDVAKRYIVELNPDWAGQQYASQIIPTSEVS